MSCRTKGARERSVSEPSLQVVCSNYIRDRLRKTDLDYERGKDKLAHWIGSWGYEEICVVLKFLLTRCPMNQMEFLWTAMESVPHRDFLYSTTLSQTINKPKKDALSISLNEEHFRPLSTPISRKITYRIKKSRRFEDKRLYRASSITIHNGFKCTERTVLNDLYLFELPVTQTESQLLLPRPITDGRTSSKLPGVTGEKSHIKPHSTSFHCQPPLYPAIETCPTIITNSPSTRIQEPEQKSVLSPHSCLTTPVSTRILTPMRRHMNTSRKSYVTTSYSFSCPTTRQETRSTIATRRHTTPGLEIRPATKLETSPTIGLETRPTTGLETRPTTGLETIGLETRPTTRLTFLSEPNLMLPLPPEAQEFLVWFSDLQTDWQQQEILQLVVWNLDKKELYFLSALLMIRQYCDFVTQLPEAMAIKVLSYVPSKDLLANCCRVSSGWNSRCSNELLWKFKVNAKTRFGMPKKNFLLWKCLYLDNLRLNRNWGTGRYVMRELVGHSKKVLCICLKENLVVSGSSDKTVRVWDLTTRECLCTLQGHSKPVWCVCFYGKNLVISGAGDGLIKVWNYRTRICERTLEFHKGPVWAIQQKKELLVSGACDKMVCIWDIRRCMHMKTLVGHKGMVFTVEMNDSTELVYSGGRRNVVMEWEVASGTCLRVIKVNLIEPSASVMSLHWSKGFMVGSSGRQITLWDTRTWEVVTSFEGHFDRIDSVQLRIYDEQKVSGLILSASKDKTIKYWGIRSAKFKCLENIGSRVNCAQCNDIYVVCGANHPVIKVWDFHPHSKQPL